MFEIDGVFHDLCFLSCPRIQTVDSTPLPVHTPTLRKKGCPASTGFPAKVLNLDTSMMGSGKKSTNNGFLLLFVFVVICAVGSLTITNIKSLERKGKKLYMNGNNHHLER